MARKKDDSQTLNPNIITTILIILLVLSAIIIVYQVVRNVYTPEQDFKITTEICYDLKELTRDEANQKIDLENYYFCRSDCNFWGSHYIPIYKDDPEEFDYNNCMKNCDNKYLCKNVEEERILLEAKEYSNHNICIHDICFRVMPREELTIEWLILNCNIEQKTIPTCAYDEECTIPIYFKCGGYTVEVLQ